MHPQTESLFIFGTNKGILGLNDLRTSINTSNTILFKHEVDQSHFLSEIINKYCDVSFIDGTRKIITRDLISIKIWDICNNKRPLVHFNIDENIESNLCDLFESDSLDDKFALTSIKNGSILTGNYGDSFHIIEEDGNNIQY
jgi:serine/threonine-protein phosphatase 2A regulatory subunit B